MKLFELPWGFPMPDAVMLKAGRAASDWVISPLVLWKASQAHQSLPEVPQIVRRRILQRETNELRPFC